jgi:putative redox protein
MAIPSRHVTVSSERGTLLNRIADDRGNTIFADEPADKGGSGKGLTPFELVIAGLGACTSMTLFMYARHRNLDLRDVVVDVRYVRAGEAGYTQDTIVRRIELAGLLDAEAMTKLGAIARRCPVHQMLEKAVPITDTVSLRETV